MNCKEYMFKFRTKFRKQYWNISFFCHFSFLVLIRNIIDDNYLKIYNCMKHRFVVYIKF